jgi:hypothetical protein
MPKVSAGFIATGIESLANIIEMQLPTPHSDEATPEGLSAGDGFVGVTSSDIIL